MEFQVDQRTLKSVKNQNLVKIFFFKQLIYQITCFKVTFHFNGKSNTEFVKE